MHLFVFSNLYTLFNLEKTAGFYLLLVGLSLSYVVATLIENALYNALTRAVYFIGATWLGIIFYLFIITLAYKILNLFFNIATPVSGVVLITVAVLLSIIGLIGGATIHEKTVVIKSKKIKNDLVIVQLSDVHYGTIRNTKFLEHLVERTNNLKPDIVVITGDLVDGTGKYTADMFLPLNNLKAPTYFVTGNHETYAGKSAVLGLLSKTTMTLLLDKKVSVKGVDIIGFDDIEGQKANISKLDKLKVNDSKYTILLNHRPKQAKALLEKGVDLMITGHTHAGQITPFDLMVMIEFRPYKGLNKIGDGYLYISPGTGTWGPPMRVGSKNEITKILLKNG